MVKPTLITIGLLFGWGLIDNFLKSQGNLMSGEFATLQLNNSDAAFMTAQTGMHFGQYFEYSFILIFAIIVYTWYVYLTRPNV